MKKSFILFMIISAVFSGIQVMAATNKEKPDSPFVSRSFDTSWRFIKDNPSGAESPSFDDSKWRIIDLPHDWSIEDLPGQNGTDVIGPFDKTSVDKMSSGYLCGGTGWYRKSFKVDAKDLEKLIFLQFDGVYMNSDVWINGKHLGNHPNGYTPFIYDITPFLLKNGLPNIVAVRVINNGLNSRWYSGSGITRHVWFIAKEKVHINPSGGVYITTPVVTNQSAEVKIVTSVTNSGVSSQSVMIQTRIFSPTGKLAGMTRSNVSVDAGKPAGIISGITLENPSLWSPDNPVLYRAEVSVLSGKGVTTDVESTTFGIRKVEISASKGLLINGVSTDLKGGCYHHDNGPLGAASIDRAEERRIEILKNAGFNAIRTSHNPPSPALLDACDRLGMVVIDEIFDMWEKPKKKQDYSLWFREWWQKDVESWILRDRNHPSVIMWSIGNEISEAADSSGYRIAGNLSAEVRRLDNTRAVTEALVDFGRRTGQNRWDAMAPHMALLDVVGYNYAYSKYEADHEKYPDRVIVATETNPPLALENWRLVEKLPYVIGYFVWTAIDNLGEAGVGVPILRDDIPENRQENPGGPVAANPLGAQPENQAGQPAANAPGMPPPNQQGPPAGGPAGGFFRADSWPIYTNYQGDLDLTGARKVPSFYQHVVWGLSKVEIFVHRPLPAGKREMTSPWGFPDELKSWNWPGHEGEKMKVHVYTGSPHVKLELNGKLVGETTVDLSKSITATFEVPYEAGTLVAHCFDNGIETAQQSLVTTGKPYSIRLLPDRSVIRADRNDLSYIMTEITDAGGNVVPDADNIVVKYEVSGEGRLEGVGNGDPYDMASFQQPQRKPYQGKCLAIIRPGTKPGKIVVKAYADGVEEAVTVLTVR